MTDKMSKALEHIESVDAVEDWAKKKCRSVFEAYDKILDRLGHTGVMLRERTSKEGPSLYLKHSEVVDIIKKYLS